MMYEIPETSSQNDPSWTAFWHATSVPKKFQLKFWACDLLEHERFGHKIWTHLGDKRLV